MRKRYLPFLPLVLLMVPAILLTAQTDHISSLSGTWKLNAAQSKLLPDTDLQNRIITITSEGRTLVAEFDTHGKSRQWSYARSEGKEVPVDGIENATMTETIGGNQVDQRFQVGHRVIWKSHGVLVNGGRILMLMATKLDEHGQLVSDILIYDKQ